MIPPIPIPRPQPNTPSQIIPSPGPHSPTLVQISPTEVVLPKNPLQSPGLIGVEPISPKPYIASNSVPGTPPPLPPRIKRVSEISSPQQV